MKSRSTAALLAAALGIAAPAPAAPRAVQTHWRYAPVSAMVRCADDLGRELRAGPWRLPYNSPPSAASLQFPHRWSIPISAAGRTIQLCQLLAGEAGAVRQAARSGTGSTDARDWMRYRVAVLCGSNETATTVSAAKGAWVGGWEFRINTIVPGRNLIAIDFPVYPGDFCVLTGGLDGGSPPAWYSAFLAGGAGAEQAVLGAAETPNTRSNHLRWCAGYAPFTITCRFSIAATEYLRTRIEYLPTFTGRIQMTGLARGGGPTFTETCTVVRGFRHECVSERSGKIPAGAIFDVTVSVLPGSDGGWVGLTDTTAPWPS